MRHYPSFFGFCAIQSFIHTQWGIYANALKEVQIIHKPVPVRTNTVSIISLSPMFLHCDSLPCNLGSNLATLLGHKNLSGSP